MDGVILKQSEPMRSILTPKQRAAFPGQIAIALILSFGLMLFSDWMGWSEFILDKPPMTSPPIKNP